MALAIWLIVKGFNAPAVVAAPGCGQRLNVVSWTRAHMTT